MEIWEWIVLAVAVGLIVVLAVALMRIRQRRAHLRGRTDSGRSTTAQSPDPEREWPSAA